MKKKLILNKIILDKIKSISIFICIFLSLLISNISAIENKIIFKVNEEIITSLDILSEIKYLNILNPNIQNLDQKTTINIAQNSIIREKIKKIEIAKNSNNRKLKDKYLEELLKNIYTKLNLRSFEEFKKYLEINNLDIRVVKNKVSIEALWNELIYVKFLSKVKVDKENLKKNILKNKNTMIKSYDLIEIVFSISKKDELDLKYQLIKNDIDTKDFSSAALIHSISDSSKAGGKLGWISEKSMNKKIKKEILLLKEGDYTKPIIIPGGALILKVNAIKEEKLEIEIDIDKELKALIKFETSRQLNQLSNLYFNKIRKDIDINEL